VQRAVPVTPTLVIGLGHFGHHVGIQLADRLLMTETEFQKEYNQPLLVREEKGHLNSGRVRIMELNWDAWFMSGYGQEDFLCDLALPSLGEADKKTPPRMREGGRHPSDWADARLGLSDLGPQMLEAAEPLRRHIITSATPYEMVTPHNFQLRIVVVCAAREVASAALASFFVEILGKLYLEKEHLAHGIQLFCYTGGTSPGEHKEAQGTDSDYDEYLSTEIDNILPESPTSLLARLEQMCNGSSRRMIEACYLLDSRLADGKTPAQRQQDAPDETVVAAALAVLTLITTDADHYIRNHTFQTDQLRFTSFGIASYVMDHPRLRQLVYSRLLSDFLHFIHPETKSERAKTPSQGQYDEIAHKSLEADVSNDVLVRRGQYSERISFNRVHEKVGNQPVQQGIRLNHSKVINALHHCDASERSNVDDVLDQETAVLADTMRSSQMLRSMLDSQNTYLSELQEAFERQLAELYESKQAHTIRIYRFFAQCKDVLEQQLQREGVSVNVSQQKQQRNVFVDEQETAYKLTFGEQVTLLCAELPRRPSLRAALGRTLIIMPLLALLLQFITGQMHPTSDATDIFMGGLNVFFPALPLWVVPLLGIVVAGILCWLLLYSIYNEVHRRRLHGSIDQLIWKQKEILKEIEKEAWKGALAEAYSELNTRLSQQIGPLFMPGGVLSLLRTQIAKNEMSKQEQVLERIFLNKQLEQALNDFGQELAGRDVLRKHIPRLVKEMLALQPVNLDILATWLQAEAAQLHRDDYLLIDDQVNKFLEQLTSQQLQFIWEGLVTAATPLVRHDLQSQEDMGTKIALLAVHKNLNVKEWEALAAIHRVRVRESVDQSRLTLLRLHNGIHLQELDLSAKSLL
jgi:hypothetical protein